MKPVYHPNISVERLEDVKPRGDLVLIKRAPERENLIIAPGWRNAGIPGVKTGIVISAGPGDRMFPMICRTCALDPMKGFRDEYRLESAKNWSCRECGAPLSFLRNPQTDEIVVWRAPMHVKAGDRVLYDRAPANDQMINYGDYTLLHEEQHILAVFEEGAEDGQK